MEQLLAKVYNGDYLSRDESFDVFSNIIEGKMSPVHLASMLTGMKMRGESVEELTGAALASLKYAEAFQKLIMNLRILLVQAVMAQKVLMFRLQVRL